MRDELNNENNMVEAENPFQAKREFSDENVSFEENESLNSDKADGETSDKKQVKAEENKEGKLQEKQEDLKSVGEGNATVFVSGNTPTIKKSELETSPKKPKSKAMRTINKIIMVVAILVFAVSAAVLVKNYVDIKKSREEADRLAQMVTTSVTEESTDAVGADGILEKYREAYNTNNDLVGWIKVPNTAIDHPVVIGSDNNEYLRKSFYGVYDRRGTIFMDSSDHVDTLCKNTILYGHNYLDSTMFSDLEKYKDIEFYRQNPIIQFDTIYKTYQWKVFCVFLTNASDSDDNGYIFNYIYPFMTDDNFEDYIGELAVRSLYFTAVDVKKTDKILTLSTCTRDMDIKGNGETNARCVVVARLVRDGESTDVDTASAIQNDNPRYPQIWYKAHGTTNPYAGANRWYPEGVEY